MESPQIKEIKINPIKSLAQKVNEGLSRLRKTDNPAAKKEELTPKEKLIDDVFKKITSIILADGFTHVTKEKDDYTVWIKSSTDLFAVIRGSGGEQYEANLSFWQDILPGNIEATSSEASFIIKETNQERSRHPDNQEKLIKLRDTRSGDIHSAQHSRLKTMEFLWRHEYSKRTMSEDEQLEILNSLLNANIDTTATSSLFNEKRTKGYNVKNPHSPIKINTVSLFWNREKPNSALSLLKGFSGE